MDIYSQPKVKEQKKSSINFVPLQYGFIDSAKSYPSHPALWSDSKTLTYKALHRLSDQFAFWLLKNNYAPKKRIALITEKSFDSIIALLGVLKAGNAYVPLNVKWPKKRLLTIIEQGDFSLVIQDKSLLLSENAFILTIEDSPWKSIFKEYNEANITNILSKLSIIKSDIAYIYYTSGTTGKPKGVMISHQAAQCFPLWAKKEFLINTSHRIAVMAPLSFDLSTFDLFSGLSGGACLYLIPEKLTLFPARISNFLKTNQITTLYAVPTTLSLLLLKGGLNKEHLVYFKTLLFAGEVFPIELAKKMKELLPETAHYYNLYGPTETNVCLYFNAKNIMNLHILPIGKPLPGVKAFILERKKDKQNNTLIEGELCIEGLTVMSGYWKQQQQEGAYRTGDHVFLNDEGIYIYKKRIDNMIKRWGYRIEIGEIEACLMKHILIEHSFIVFPTIENKNNTASLISTLNHTPLVALIVLKNKKQEISSLTKILVKHCQEYLPHYMIPSHIYEITTYPLNTSGKIDKHYLNEWAKIKIKSA
jgi:amino acid adenylation domain-containing protein